MILAVDVGFVATGVALMAREGAGWRAAMVACISAPPDPRKRKLLVAHQDAARVAHIARRLRDIVRNYGVKRIVVELPHGGAQGARANRCMGMATAMIVALAECEGLAAEYYTPMDTRTAAVPGARKVSKDEVAAAMSKRWPGVVPQAPREVREAVADALATFAAAESGNLVRSL